MAENDCTVCKFVNNVDIDKIFLVDVSLFGKTYTVRIKADNEKIAGKIACDYVDKHYKDLMPKCKCELLTGKAVIVD